MLENKELQNQKNDCLKINHKNKYCKIKKMTRLNLISLTFLVYNKKRRIANLTQHGRMDVNVLCR